MQAGVQTHQWHIGDGEVSWLPSDLDWKFRFESGFIKAGKGHPGCSGFKVCWCKYSKIMASEIKGQHKAPGTLKETCVWFFIPWDTITLWKNKSYHKLSKKTSKELGKWTESDLTKPVNSLDREWTLKNELRLYQQPRGTAGTRHKHATGRRRTYK